MPEIQNSALPVECKVGNYLDSPFHKSAPTADNANSAKETSNEVSKMRDTALSVLHADSHVALDQRENKLVEQLVQLHRDPTLEHAVIDKLAIPDPTQKLPVADIVLNDNGLQAISFVPGCEDTEAKIPAITAFYDEIDNWAANPAAFQNFIKRWEHE